jgi:hypothetical protein
MKKMKAAIEKAVLKVVKPKIGLDGWGGKLPAGISVQKPESPEEKERILKKMNAIRGIKNGSLKPGKPGIIRMLDVLEKAGNFNRKK